VSSNLQIICGAEPTRGSGTSPDVVSQFFESLIRPFGFFNPTIGLISELNLSRGLYSLLSQSEHLEFESVRHLAQALSDLDSIAIALHHMDSEEFAIWCGLGKSDARSHLLELVSEMQQARIRVQEAQLQLDFSQNLPSAKALSRSLTQLALVGVVCDPRQLQRAWLASTRKPLSKKWTSKYQSIRAFDGRGVLVEGEALTFVYRVKWKGVGEYKPAFGLVRNRLVIDLGGIRSFVELPAACSRMEPGSVRLSKNKFEIDFTARESEWPRS
jgi:hypothetical protein